MALQACIVANPTSVNVTVNAKVALARRITKLNLEDTPGAAVVAEAMTFIAAGCAVVRQDLAGFSSVESREQVGFLLENEQQDTA